MTKKISDLLDIAGTKAVAVLGGITDDRLKDATPCAEYDVRGLVNHLFHVVVHFQLVGARKPYDKFDDSVDHVGRGADWRERFAVETGKLVEIWAAPGADEGTAGSLDMPARTVIHMVLGDLTVHAWDLATATGQEYAADPAVLEEVGPALAEMAPQARQAGVFGEAVDVPESATELDRVLAATGRDPRWTRPA
ncbi:TIGR03086 family metal-binding protein [Streptomyces sp. NBC_01304]|uniref:TIGR03086 family metal-binding protein n=1 Tax=Streptomyces sp. NBC_01304 TaxID=2903818 RepID=UPI002E132317|nr:TIGR03086 family metal-binding protein [Streptomyces sp. NBC_01304]